jgi:hypothetical protein
MWNYSLSDAEIKRSYDQPKNPLGKTAVAVWKFTPDAGGLLISSINSELNGKIYNTEIKANEDDHNFINNYIPFTMSSVEFTENNSLFHRVSLLLKDKQYREIVKLFDSARYKSNQPPVDHSYFERDNPFECLVLAYCFFEMKDISKSKTYYNRYEQIKDLNNNVQTNNRFNLIQGSFYKYLISQLKYIE